MLQIGNHVDATWKARLADNLGHFGVELRRGFAAPLMEDAAALAAVTSMASLTRLLPERDPHPSLFEITLFVLGYLDDAGRLAGAAGALGAGLLDELGFGLDLATCAATGGTADLIYVSPRSGRAVSAEAGEPYKDRLLALPGFLRGGPAGERQPRGYPGRPRAHRVFPGGAGARPARPGDAGGPQPPRLLPAPAIIRRETGDPLRPSCPGAPACASTRPPSDGWRHRPSSAMAGLGLVSGLLSATVGSIWSWRGCGRWERSSSWTPARCRSGSLRGAIALGVWLATGSPWALPVLPVVTMYAWSAAIQVAIRLQRTIDDDPYLIAASLPAGAVGAGITHLGARSSPRSCGAPYVSASRARSARWPACCFSWASATGGRPLLFVVWQPAVAFCIGLGLRQPAASHGKTP